MRDDRAFIIIKWDGERSILRRTVAVNRLDTDYLGAWTVTTLRVRSTRPSSTTKDHTPAGFSLSQRVTCAPRQSASGRRVPIVTIRNFAFQQTAKLAEPQRPALSEPSIEFSINYQMYHWSSTLDAIASTSNRLRART
jgi:hypothetical protein